MPEVKLSITPIEGSPDNYKVEISGSGFEFAANKEARWKLRGDDLLSDDDIIDPRGSGVVGPNGTFYFTGNAIGENLNEDWGKDEIYAVVSIVGLGGHHFQLRVQQGQWPLLKSDCGDDNLLDALIAVIFNLNGYNRCVQIFFRISVKLSEFNVIGSQTN